MSTTMASEPVTAGRPWPRRAVPCGDGYGGTRGVQGSGWWLQGGLGIVMTGLLMLAGVGGARAQGDPKVALENIPMGLEPVPNFADPDAAQRHCPGDTVVWPDPNTGYYHPPRSSRFAAVRGGYACMGDAVGAGYWDTNPFSEGLGKRRSFPIDPALRPEVGS